MTFRFSIFLLTAAIAAATGSGAGEQTPATRPLFSLLFFHLVLISRFSRCYFIALAPALALDNGALPQAQSSVLPGSLGILERKPARPLVGARPLTNLAIAPKHDNQ